jgi:acetyl esterase/lipase
VAEGRRLGLDSRRLAIGGDSAGGNLAAVAAILARDAGISLCAQLLLYPVTDCAGDHRSRMDYGDGFLLTRDTMAWFGGNYLDGQPHEDWRASPLRAPDLGGLPPAIVIVGECDMLRDESRSYAEALARAGQRGELPSLPRHDPRLLHHGRHHRRGRPRYRAKRRFSKAGLRAVGNALSAQCLTPQALSICASAWPRPASE